MRGRLIAAELVATCVSGVLAIITIAWPQWVELVFRADPDHGSGALEILIVGVLIAVAVASSLAARAQIRRGAVARLGAAR